MAFTPNRRQLRNAGVVVRRGNRKGATLREKMAALETILTEANGLNVGYGDRDSEGAFQQRPSQGWGPASEPLRIDADQFYDAAIRLRGKVGGGAGRLAQAVQRSAYPDRYRQRRADALALLRAVRGGGGGGAAAPKGASPVGGSSTAFAGGSFDAGSAGGMPDIELPGRPQIASAGLVAPAFSAQAVMPAGMQVQSGGGPAPRASALDSLPSSAGFAATFGGAAGGASRTVARKRARESLGVGGIAHNNTAAGLVDGLDGWVESELGLKAGSRDRSPGENAAAGGAGDSDHLEGVPGGKRREARDYPTTAAQGGWGQYRQVVRKLGLKPAANGFTEGTIKVGKKRFRVQVIFGEQNDHGDHIHVGFRRV